MVFEVVRHCSEMYLTAKVVITVFTIGLLMINYIEFLQQ